MKETIVGIDLGTTNSEVAVFENMQPALIKRNNTAIFPSYVGIDQDGKLLVGEAARNQYPVYPERTVKSIKRLMGSGEKVTMAGKQYAPQEISAIILKSLKEIAEEQLGHAVSRAVITVPAYFSDIQRQATREAGEVAGFETIKMINEPTAAALAYEGAQHDGKTIMVYDLGGGTFDVSVVRIEDGVIEVVASHGNNQLGGDDFDRKIVDYVHKHLAETHGEITLSPEAEARIIRAAEQAKLTLSDNPFAEIREEYLFEKDGVPVHLALELSRDTYEEMSTPFIDETLDAIHIALQGADLTASDIEEVLLVGGSSRTPLVHEYIEREFGILPRSEVDPDLCVACGAAIQAAMIAGEEVSAVLVDITPYTFGTGSLDFDIQRMGYKDIYVPLIKKNTPIPTRKSEVFYTMYDNQESVRVRVYQGENSKPNENIEIGEFLISGLSEVPEGNEIITTFALDTDGILQVTATEKCSGLSKTITIDNAIGRFQEDELARAKGKIVELFGDDTDDAQPVVEEGATPEPEFQEAEKTLVKAEHLMENAEPEDREEMVDLAETIKDAMRNKDADRRAESVNELNEIIFYLES
ncbi:MAG TPA: heat-shock protein Hsp70 [Desulfobulbaceae bacterium]|nr:heat-shock protein Hsp70 [Desulfobulbaceae bacterium]